MYDLCFQAERCVVDLDVPHFHHEIVYEAIQIALEDGTKYVLNGITDLLKHLSDAAMVTVDQMNVVSILYNVSHSSKMYGMFAYNPIIPSTQL